MLLAALVVAGCSGGAGDQSVDTEASTVVVPRDTESREFIVTVFMTDAGFDPEMIFIPAGRQVRLVLRNQGTTEHHYRVVGLIPSDLRWRMEPDLTADEIESSPEFAGVYVDDVEHVLHHMTPTFVPFKEESPNGIRPIGNEVHGYARQGGHDTVTFFAQETGTYDVIDALHPDLTGTIVVFDPRPADA